MVGEICSLDPSLHCNQSEGVLTSVNVNNMINNMFFWVHVLNIDSYIL